MATETLLTAILAGLPERRPQQEKYALAVAKALEEKRCLAAEAPVGTGKSFGYLLPAAASGLKVFVATHSLTLQDQLRTGDLPFVQKLMEAQGHRWRWAILKGSGNYACHHKADQAGVDGELKAWLQGPGPHELALAPAGTPETTLDAIRTDTDECLRKACPYFADCAYRAARAEAQRADLVVSNQAMLLIATKNPMAMDLSIFGAVVVDEAHQLPDVARSQYSVELGRGTVQRVFGQLARLSGRDEARALVYTARDAWAKLSEAALVAREGRGRVEAGERWGVAPGAIAHPLALLAEAVEAGQAELAHIHDEAERLSAGIKLDNLQVALMGLREASPTSVLTWEATGGKEMEGWGTPGKAVLAPVEVADMLADALFNPKAVRKCGACEGYGDVGGEVCPACDGDGLAPMGKPQPFILTSATLAVGAGGRALDFGPFMAEVGLDTEETDAAAVSSPFNYKRQAVLYVPAVDDAKLRDKEPHAFLAEVDWLVQANRGRAFVLFTSRRGMDQAFNGRGHTFPSRAQTPDADRMELIRWFKGTKGAVLYALASFWEGVSIEGPQLGLVIIDKLPFPVPTDPVYAARVQLAGGSKVAFTKLGVPIVATKMRQGAGRLIRTPRDVGVVAVLDGRLSGFASLRQAVLPSLLPGAPVVHDRKALVAAWRATGAELDLGPEWGAAPPKAPPPMPKAGLAPLAPGAHPVLALLPPTKGGLIHGKTPKALWASIEPLLAIF